MLSRSRLGASWGEGAYIQLLSVEVAPGRWKLKGEWIGPTWLPVEVQLDVWGAQSEEADDAAELADLVAQCDRAARWRWLRRRPRVTVTPPYRRAEYSRQWRLRPTGRFNAAVRSEECARADGWRLFTWAFWRSRNWAQDRVRYAWKGWFYLAYRLGLFDEAALMASSGTTSPWPVVRCLRFRRPQWRPHPPWW